MFPLFNRLILETNSLCNRRCPTCLRQRDPTRSRWNPDGCPKNIDLPTKTVYDVINQAAELGYKGKLGLHWFNEPLLDPRIPGFAAYAKKKGLPFVYLATNGDILLSRTRHRGSRPARRLARKLDAALDQIVISLYASHPVAFIRPLRESNPVKFRSYRRLLGSLFPNTEVVFAGRHVTTHYSPRYHLKNYIERMVERTCWTLCHNRMIVSYTGEMAFCCEDIMFNWDLGTVYDQSLVDLWFSPHHQKILEVLSKRGGRHTYKYCETCPRYGRPLDKV